MVLQMLQLLEAGDELKPGMIRDSNRIMLITLLREHGFIVKDLGIALDRCVHKIFCFEVCSVVLVTVCCVDYRQELCCV